MSQQFQFVVDPVSRIASVLDFLLASNEILLLCPGLVNASCLFILRFVMGV